MKRLTYLLAVLPLFLLWGCNNDDFEQEGGTTPPTGGDIEFNIGFAPQTKVATDTAFESTWETGDLIGIFAVKRATGNSATLRDTGNYIHNVKLIYSAADGGSWTADIDLWHAPGSEVLDFYAYYPYNDNAGAPRDLNPTSIAFAVNPDQSTAVNYSQSDLLSADKVSGIVKGTNVNLQFKHMLSLVEVVVNPTYIDRNGGFTATLRECKTASSFNLSTGAVTSIGDARAVKMLRVEANPATATTYTYRALVPAQTIAQDSKLCLMAQNEYLFHSPALGTALELNAGVAKLYTAELPATALATVPIKAGTFMMGSPTNEPSRNPDNETQHEVTLTKDFYMGKYAITNAQYAVFLNATNVGVDRKATVSGFGDQVLFEVNTWLNVNLVDGKWVAASTDIPMINVNWFGAKAYADWAGGSLPTEAQWEYACRAGTTTAYSFGDNAAQLGDYAWYSGAGEPKAIGTKLPNDWGLYDMHGNVFEWCSDWYDDDYDPTAATNPTGPANGDVRMLRGGGWFHDAQDCRSAFRSYNPPVHKFSNFGFRVVFVP